MPESVWDYPRPPRIEPCDKRVRVVLGRAEIADTTRLNHERHPGPFKGGPGTSGW
jgi:uncharacterized protein (DUF427 family)